MMGGGRRKSEEEDWVVVEAKNEDEKMERPVADAAERSKSSSSSDGSVGADLMRDAFNADRAHILLQALKGGENGERVTPFQKAIITSAVDWMKGLEPEMCAAVAEGVCGEVVSQSNGLKTVLGRFLHEDVHTQHAAAALLGFLCTYDQRSCKIVARDQRFLEKCAHNIRWNGACEDIGDLSLLILYRVWPKIKPTGWKTLADADIEHVLVKCIYSPADIDGYSSQLMACSIIAGCLHNATAATLGVFCDDAGLLPALAHLLRSVDVDIVKAALVVTRMVFEADADAALKNVSAPLLVLVIRLLVNCRRDPLVYRSAKALLQTITAVSDAYAMEERERVFRAPSAISVGSAGSASSASSSSGCCAELAGHHESGDGGLP